MTKKEQYVSIKEFSERAGVSQQAIYQRLNTSLKDFLKIDKGQKLININALMEVYGISLEQENSDLLDKSFNKYQHKIELLQLENASNKQIIQKLEQSLKESNDLIKMLQQQAEEKDKQIKENSDRLHDLLENEQKILFKMIEQKRLPSDTVGPESKKKKHLFKFMNGWSDIE